MLGYGSGVIFFVGDIYTTCYLVNRSHSSLDFKILVEVWLGNHVDYSILRVLDVLHMLISIQVN